ncbi:MAG: transcriptional repressor [Azospira sp.]|jgi:Fur family ferric uptake transcriptional regulator|nr:transcriptional repressor [Azospira sp.]
MPDTIASPPASPPTDSDTLAGRIRATGARATPARIRVLELLTRAPAPLSHQDIESALGPASLDRVTLYRVLDWLVESGLAVKRADERRVWRFSVAGGGTHHGHVHFRCEACGCVFCIDAPAPRPPRLPGGFTLARAELDLSGRCAECNAGNA